MKVQHRTSESFHVAMVLFQDSIEIFTGTNRNRGPVLHIVAEGGNGIRSTLMDGNFLRHAVTTNGFG